LAWFAAGLAYVPASLLDEQEYCEFRLHYRLMEGRVEPGGPGEARRTVRRAAFRLSDSRFGGVAGFKRVSVYGEVFGVPVAASPDAALVEDGTVKALLRGRIRDPPRVYESDYTRLLAAAYLLDSMGRLAEDARLAVVVGRDAAALKRLVEAVAASGVKPARAADGLVAVRIYRREDAEARLHRLMEYWRGEREPLARPSPGRCGACEYAASCPHAARREARR